MCLDGLEAKDADSPRAPGLGKGPGAGAAGAGVGPGVVGKLVMTQDMCEEQLRRLLIQGMRLASQQKWEEADKVSMGHLPSHLT